MSFEIKKIYTDNPYVDELVYYAKLLSMGTVLKMQQTADNNETVDSIRMADLYIACIEKTAILELFPSISINALRTAGITNPISISEYRRNSDLIPSEYREYVLEAMRTEYIENYEELNPYYRMLHGLPAIGIEDYVTDWEPPDGIEIDLSKPIHKMSSSEIAILNSFGIIDNMISEDPVNREYMKHLCEKSIDYYAARKANRFDVLYIPEIPDNNSIYKIYRDTLENNKFYTLRAVYSEAFKYNSTHYDNFIAIFIILTTVVDIISRTQEFIARKEIFDIRSIQYIFESNGVTFFPEIPFKYQVRMVKNLHTLLKFKSTKKCMMDICSLFGFEDIDIFKYYICKEKSDPDTPANDPSSYDLKFLKLPLDGRLNDYAGDPSNYVSYDDVTSKDSTWDGGLDHDDVYNNIRMQEFNFSRSKYISITSIYDVAKISIQQSYFFNFLYDNIPLEKMCAIKIPFIDASAIFNIADVFILLNILTYYFNGINDLIVGTQSKVLYVNGFNFRVNLSTLAEEIYNCDDAKNILNRFNIPTNQIPSFDDMMSIFVNNMDVRDRLIEGMRNADNKRIYDIYKKLYDSLMVTRLTYDFFKNPETQHFYIDENGDATYTEFLRSRNEILFNVAIKAKSITDSVERNQYISTIVDNIVWCLEEFVDSVKFQGIFSSLPTNNLDTIKRYIAKVINFYKSFKVHFNGFDTIYLLGNPNFEHLHVVDGIDNMDIAFNPADAVAPFDGIGYMVCNKITTDTIHIFDRLYIKHLD